MVPYQWRHHCDSRRRNKLGNPTTRAAFTQGSTGWSPHSSQPLFILRRAVWQTVATNATWLKITLKWFSRMTTQGEGLLSGSLNCRFHSCRWHLKDNENFLKPTNWKYLKEALHPSSSRRDTNDSWLKTPCVQNPKHGLVFFQQTRKQNSPQQNPYIFDTFALHGGNTAKLSTCCLQYGTSYYPELDHEGEFNLRILNDLVNFRCVWHSWMGLLKSCVTKV